MGAGSTSFVVEAIEATPDGLGRLVDRFADKPGVATSLIAKLHAAELAGQGGPPDKAGTAAAVASPSARQGVIEAFNHEVMAQSGKSSPSAEEVDILIALARHLWTLRGAGSPDPAPPRLYARHGH